MKNLRKIFYKKKIIITGHTGFKGSWLSLWLSKMGADVLGISDNIKTQPSIFKVCKLEKRIKHSILDIRKFKKLKKKIESFKPDFIFHLAAQALVKKSYEFPLLTWQTNTLGTLNLLEVLRKYNKKCTVILITSDKAYKNLEIKRGYHENDILAGIDPYSASKSSADIAIQSYINSYFKDQSKIKISIARAGNVIGGGDWSVDRLLPDCVKSWSKSRKVFIRNPNSTRPWQHVLEALMGYLFLAFALNKDSRIQGEAFNFGPNYKKNYSVLDVIKIFKLKWKNASWILKSSNKFFESNLLKLNCNKAKKKLKYKSILSFKQTVSLTAEWYKEYYRKKVNMYDFSVSQINEYEKILKIK